MTFDRFDLLDSVFKRSLVSSERTLNIKNIVGDKHRKTMLNMIFSEEKKSIKKGFKECRKYERYKKKMIKKSKKVKKTIIAIQKERLQNSGQNVKPKRRFFSFLDKS